LFHELATLLPNQAGPDDEVDGSELVLKHQENYSAGSHRPMVDGADAAPARKLPILEIVQCLG
jgi:hypothetical protein